MQDYRHRRGVLKATSSDGDAIIYDGEFARGQFSGQGCVDHRRKNLTKFSRTLAGWPPRGNLPDQSGHREDPEDSEFTSIYERIRLLKRIRPRASTAKPRVPLLAFKDTAERDRPGAQTRQRGAIDKSLPPILTRLNIDSQAWQAVMQPRGNVFGRARQARSSSFTRQRSWPALGEGPTAS